MSSIVYVVHCVDTEGPLYEAFDTPFKQIKDKFGIEIAATEENLIKLRNGEMDLNGKEASIMNLVDIHKAAINGNWDILKNSLSKITNDEFRNRLCDSSGNGWIYSWFCLDHVGFKGKNPRRRDVGHHKIFDRYTEMVNEQKKGDIVQFHHHPISHSGNFNECGTAYWGRGTLNEILTRKVLDRFWFPTAYRPGFHTERPDSHWFLEQWIPFDYGNQSIDGVDTDQPDLELGRFGDWRSAPLEWKPYHPSYKSYQEKGECNRWITRCLNMYARLREIKETDVADAFKEARNFGNSILAFTDHDFKDMEFDINRVRGFIKKIHERYKDVKFEFTDAITAMRKCCNLKESELELDCCLIQEKEKMKLLVKTNKTIFGSQPYLAIKTIDGIYIWDNFDFGTNNTWHYTFDNETIPFWGVEKIGVASNNTYGRCEIMRYTAQSEYWEKVILN